MYMMQQQAQQQQAQLQQQQQSKRSESSDEDQFNQLLQERLNVRPTNQTAAVQEVVPENQEQLIVFSDSDTNANQSSQPFPEAKVKKKPTVPVPHKPPKPQRNVSCPETIVFYHRTFSSLFAESSIPSIESFQVLIK